MMEEREWGRGEGVRKDNREETRKREGRKERMREMGGEKIFFIL